MWDGTPPRQGRGQAGPSPRRPAPGGPPPQPRVGPSGPPRKSPQGAPDPNNPYRPYGQGGTSSRLPAPYRPGSPGTLAQPSARPPAAVGTLDPDESVAPAHKHIGFAIFHDGNPGHLWRGAVASALGEAVLAAGMVMWLAGLTSSPQAIALGVVAMGLPFLLTGLLGTRFENAPEPGRPLKWIGRLRIVLTLGLIPMHYHTILPVVFALLFAISLCGRLHDALRTAVTRTCLAPGELEHVANDMHIGASLAAVIGPLLATASYVLLGERVLLVSVAAATIFLLSLNSEGFLDALPPARRDFLLATPRTETMHDEWDQSRIFDSALDEDDVGIGGDTDEDEEDGLDPEQRRELKLPPWYQQGPQSAWQALADIRAGFGLAGTTPASTTALWAIALLSLAGGGLSVLEVFYLSDRFGLPSLYLGALLACESAGLALGALLAGDARTATARRVRLLGGVLGAGVALAVFAAAPMLPVALAAAFALGVANALAVQAARQALLDGFDGIEQRALAASEAWLAALCGVIGALAFTAFYVGVPRSLLGGWPVGELFLLTGGGLALGGIVLGVLMSRKPTATSAAAEAAGDGTGVGALDAGDLALDGEDGDDESGYLPSAGRTGSWTGEYNAAEDDYGASYGYQGRGYGPAARGGAYDDEYEDDGDDADDYDEPPSRRGQPPGRSSRRNPRPRW